jgi:hypothetical protein
MRKVLTGVVLVLLATAGMGQSSCGEVSKSDAIQRQQGEKLLQEATAQTGMPALVNFRERKLLKDILEMRDQDGLVTYTYVFNELQGKLVFLCNSIGYGIPYATQYTNPQKPLYMDRADTAVIDQADPNGLFSPSSAEGTWVQCSDPAKAGAVRTVYIEPRIIVSPFKLD